MFEIVNGIVQITPEILLIDVFKRIWEDDTTEKKDIAIKNIAYVYFMCSPKKNNPYFGYEISVRGYKIMTGIKLEVEQLSPHIEEAMKFYENYLENFSPTLSLFNAALFATGKLKEYLLALDMNKTTATGMLVLKPKDVTNALSDIGKIIKDLNSLRDIVNKELSDTGKTRKDREINPFETGEI